MRVGLISHLLHFAMAERILGGIYLLSIEPVNAGVDFNAEHGISHIISVVPGVLPSHITSQYTHLQIPITDEETTNLLDELPQATDFIDAALFPPGTDLSAKKHNGEILVHCAQGKSRSVSVVVAYLMKKYNLSYSQALHAVTRKVADAEPNAGFAEQLEVYKQMGCTVDKSLPQYRKFLVDNSLKQDPSGSLLPQLDIYQTRKAVAPTAASLQLRCKKCRHVLATLMDIQEHEAPDKDSEQSRFIRRVPNRRRIISLEDGADTCSHYFMGEPVEWMSGELSKQELEGKFACPKCEAKVGGYSWRGSRCSCGKWMIPALHLQLAKVDAMKSGIKPLR